MEILYQDEHFVAVNKLADMMVHRTRLIPKEEVVVLEHMTKQLGQNAKAVHRLDRPTTGVLLLALHTEATQLMSKIFRERNVEKQYWAIVNGHPPANFVVEKPLQSGKNKPIQKALTHFKTLQTFKLPSAEDILPNHQKFALVEAMPLTGRQHQIRKHLRAANHPILVDKKHGNKRLNRFFRMTFNQHSLLLHAKELRFLHPFTKEELVIKADLPIPFVKTLQLLAQN